MENARNLPSGRSRPVERWLPCRAGSHPKHAMDENRGFTLIELMITIAVMAILMSIAVPAFQSFVQNGRMAGRANEVMAGLAYARSEAVKRAADVTVCASSDGSTCSGTWTQGWVVLDQAGNVLRTQDAVGGSATLDGTGTLVFSANGRMTNPGALTALTLCPGVADIAGRTIEIEPSGRARVSTVACP